MKTSQKQTKEDSIQLEVSNQLENLFKLQKTYSFIIDTVSSKMCKELYIRKLKITEQKIYSLKKQI